MSQIRYFSSQLAKSEYYFKDTYICTVDMEQKNKHDFKGENGKEYNLYLDNKKVRNHRLAHPNLATVYQSTEGSQFKKGDGLIVRHFTFEDGGFKPNVYHRDGEVDYYKATNFDIMFGVVDGEIVCREGCLLCEPVKDKLLETTVDLPVDYYGDRRDMAKVLQIWEGCTEYKVGDYLILETGADYKFKYKGVEYIKVDHYFDDVLGVTEDPNIYIDEVRLEVRDHDLTIQI